MSQWLCHCEPPKVADPLQTPLHLQGATLSGGGEAIPNNVGDCA
jgi:hypothetical protein